MGQGPPLPSPDVFSVPQLAELYIRVKQVVHISANLRIGHKYSPYNLTQWGRESSHVNTG